MRDPSKVRLDERGARGVQSSRGTSSARCSGIRDHGATSTTVQTAPEPVLARTWRRPSLRRAPARRPRPGRARAAARRLRELDELEPQLPAPAARPASARARPQPVALGRRVAQRDRSPPRAAADEPRRQRELATRAAALLPGEQPVEQDAERTPERELVADRLGELERLGELATGGGVPLRAPRAASREAPGAPAVRPQSFGNGGARQPRKLSQPLHPELLQLLAAAARRAEQVSGSGARNSASARRRRRAPAPAARRARRRARRTSARRADPRVPAGPTAASARFSAGSIPP